MGRESGMTADTRTMEDSRQKACLQTCNTGIKQLRMCSVNPTPTHKMRTTPGPAYQSSLCSNSSSVNYVFIYIKLHLIKQNDCIRSHQDNPMYQGRESKNYGILKDPVHDPTGSWLFCQKTSLYFRNINTVHMAGT